MLLGEVKVVLGECLCLQASVDIAFKGEDRLAAFCGVKSGCQSWKRVAFRSASLSLMLISLPICGALSLRAMPISC